MLIAGTNRTRGERVFALPAEGARSPLTTARRRRACFVHHSHSAHPRAASGQSAARLQGYYPNTSLVCEGDPQSRNHYYPLLPPTKGTLGNIQGTSGNIQGTSGNIQGTSGNIQGTSGNIQGTSGNIQGTSGNISTRSATIKLHFCALL
eukprot:1196279-Prorocentrum_minimum.AAC.5